VKAAKFAFARCARRQHTWKDDILRLLIAITTCSDWLCKVRPITIDATFLATPAPGTLGFAAVERVRNPCVKQESLGNIPGSLIIDAKSIPSSALPIPLTSQNHCRQNALDSTSRVRGHCRGPTMVRKDVQATRCHDHVAIWMFASRYRPFGPSRQSRIHSIASSASDRWRQRL
jgi:hypothetical protein